MARDVDVRVSVIPIETIHGGWCRDCALPSGLRVLCIFIVNQHQEMRWFDSCGDCGGQNVEPPSGNHL